MKDKLRDLMKADNLTASKLASMLEIQPAAISHILAGRNKPGYDFICKIINRFPHINPYWLLGDAPNMYRKNEDAENVSDEQPNVLAQNRATDGNLFAVAGESASTVLASSQTRAILPNTPTSAPTTSSDVNKIMTCNEAVKKIVVFYEDSTFEVYNQRR